MTTAIPQISVFLENKSGRLAGVSSVLKSSGINIRALSIAETANYGVLRMIVNRPDDTVRVLKEAGFMARTDDVLAVSVDDREGVMYDIMKLCGDDKINVEYMYSFVEQASKRAILFMRFDEKDKEEAAKIFLEGGYRLLSEEDVCRI